MRRFQLWLGLGVVAACAIDQRDPTVGGQGGAGGSGVMTGQAAALPAGGEPICEAGQYQCRGPLLQTCADDRRSWVGIDKCASAALCHVGEGHVGEGHVEPGQADPPACLAPACGGDEMTCAGALLQRCNADRTGWDVFATCMSPAHCNAERRQCTPEPCTAGERRCDRSDADQSPALEACRSDRLDWEALDACATSELCNQALHPASGVLVAISDGVPQPAVSPPAMPAPDQVNACALAACAPGELRCDGQRLLACAPSRTSFELVEECASSALCQASTTNVSSNGKAACLAPACAANGHLCSEAGVLQVCNEERTGFRVIQSCIGPAYCNAALADQGQEGCRATPCEPGQMQCNGAQIQVCRQDRSGLDASGAACDSAQLCSAADPTHAVCTAPSCHRGPTSGDEFRCEGSTLLRCNESSNGYDAVATCVNASLCDASQRLDGCQPPACQAQEHTCTAGVLQTCKADQTGFEDTTDCGSQAGCDSNAGQCVTQCEPGSVRCNAQSGDLEECKDLETGWQTVADCLSLALCDVSNRRCNPPVCAAGDRKCETRDGSPSIVECAPGREAFNVTRTCAPSQICDAQNSECDVCTPNAVRCEGDTLVTCDANGQSESRQACAAGLCSETARRCLACGPIGSARCTDQQLLVCTQNAQGEFEASEFCATDALCAQTLQTCGSGLQGQNCQCTPGACRANQVTCNGTRVQRCNEGLTGFDTLATCSAAALCNPATADCNTCVANEYSCNNNQLRQCASDGRSFARTNINLECASATQLRVCNGTQAGTQACPNGCTTGRGCNQCTGSGVQCINGNTIRRCVDGFFQDQFCQGGFGCNPGSTQCNTCSGNGDSCPNSFTQQSCSNGQITASIQCQMGCLNNRCANCTTSQCGPGISQRRECLLGQLQNPVNCDNGNPCDGTEGCAAGACTPGRQLNCDDSNSCTFDDCSFGNGCTHRPLDNGIDAPGACCILAHCDNTNDLQILLSCVDGRLDTGTICAEGGFLCVPGNSFCVEPPPQP